jgi:hypothetical protein
LTGIVTSLVVLAAVIVAALFVLACAALLLLRRHTGLRRAVLRLRAEYAAPGPHAEVLDMRVDIQDEMRAARRAVESARHASGLASDLPDLLERLEAAAVRVDAELRILEEDEWPPPSALRSARARVGQLVSSARRVRSAASAALASASKRELDQVHEDVDRNVRWVRDAIDALDELDAPGRVAR